MPTTTPHPSAEDLAAFDAGALPAATAEEVERHVSGCAACCRLLEALPENPLAERLREFARGSTAAGGDTGRGSALPTLVGEIPPELAAHPRFEVLGLVGTGAMGAVYRARQRNLDRPVAVKVLHRRLTDRPGFAERFHRETHALARLNHPNIVQAHDADRAGESHFLVMEFVAGESFDALVRRRGPRPPAEACELARQVATGLQHAHERHLVHRDIKPGNLLLTEQGVVKIADFGLARLVGADEPPEPGSAPVVLGTPAFMAPEQARDAARADVRSDLYSLGCTLYFLLTGKPPFTGTSHLQTLMDHQDAPVPAMPGVPREVVAIVHRLLAKDPSERFATAAEAAGALARAAVPQSTTPANPHRWRLAALATCGLAGSVALAVSLSGPGSRPAEPMGPGAGEQVAGPEVAPLPRVIDRDRLATPEELAALRRARADEVIEWVRANNKWKPDAEIATTNAARVEKAFPKADSFVLTFGSGLMRSGKPTLVAAQAGGLFAFELTPEQAKGAGLGPMSHVFGSHSFLGGARRRVSRVELSDFRLSTAASHPVGARIDGEITCDFASPPEPGDHLRLTHYHSDGRRVSFLYHPKPLPGAGRVTLRFSANPIEEDRPRDQWLVPVFAEWASRGAGGDVIESNTKAALVLLQGEP